MIHKRLLPPLGQRILKTAAAVFIILIFYMLQGHHGNVGSACVTAILVMQPYMSDTRTFALERISGTLLGALWGLTYLLLMRDLVGLIPGVSAHQSVAYFLMAVFVMLAIYSTVVIKRSSLAALVAIVMLGVVSGYPNVSDPVHQTLYNLADTIVGTIVAIAVNVFRLPRRKRPEYLFFVRTMDLVPDRFRQIPSSVHIALELLLKDGARICLVSRWAPAFIISQMGLLNVKVPMIIMDGAALYDLQENKYLDVIDIPKPDVERLRSILASFHVGCNIYTVNEHTLSIFRDGPISEAEQKEFETMKRSPYRHYLDGIYREEDYVTFLRVNDTEEKIKQLYYELQSVLPAGMFRMEIREDARFPEYLALYFYSPKATQEEMKRRICKIMEQEAKTKLYRIDMLPRTTRYLPEHDAMLLLNRLKNIYEPVTILPRRKQKQETKQGHS